MKLSNREKILLIVLMFCCISYFVINYDHIQSFSDSHNNNNDVIEKYKNMYEIIRMKKTNENKIKELTNEIKKLNIVINVKQEDVIDSINDYILKNSITVSNMSFAETYNESVVLNNMFVMSNINIEFECSYDNMLNFIDEMQRSTKSIAITSIDIVSKNSDVVHGNISINYYSIVISDF